MIRFENLMKFGEEWTSTQNPEDTLEPKKQFDDVQNPQHYADSNIEVIDYIEDKNLGFCLGNAIKYISRAGKKHSVGKSDKEKTIQDLNKAIWYLNRRIKEIEEELCD